MQHIGSLKKSAKVKPPDPHLHSASHLLADELINLFQDKKHFGLYLGIALKYPHDYLRKIAQEVLEMKDVKTPGKLFTFLVKKKSKPE
jgi:hypothetical protein